MKFRETINQQKSEHLELLHLYTEENMRTVNNYRRVTQNVPCYIKGITRRTNNIITNIYSEDQFEYRK